VAKGWGFYDDRKVLVTEYSLESSRKVSDEFSVSVVLRGYSLLDANSFASVKSEFLGLVVAESLKESERGVIKIRGKSDSKVTNRPDNHTTSHAIKTATPTVTGLSVESKKGAGGTTKTFVFFDIEWHVVAPQGEGLIGTLLLLDSHGRQRVAMPWTISSSDAAAGSFAESGVGFDLNSFGEAGQWLRLISVSDLTARFEVKEF
jgi:hypothetical protein